MTARYHEFMHHHQKIERWLRGRSGNGSRGFMEMARLESLHHPLLRKNIARLRELNELRNLLAHKSGDRSEPIAEPTASVVLEIGRLAEQLASPPRLPRRVLHGVEVFTEDQSLADALRLMEAEVFSQVPVSSAGRVRGVLTSSTIMRWLASNVKHELVDVVSTPISAVLAVQERDDHWSFAPATADCAEVLGRFVNSQQAGSPLEVLLLTDTGGEQLPLRGIITVSDLGELADSLVQGNR